MSASNYARGTTLYNSLEATYGTDKAVQAWRDAIAAERSGVNVDGVWRADYLAALQGKNAPALDGSFWSVLGGQIYNDPLAAPLEQGGKILSSTVTAAGDAAKGIVTKFAGNWGAWLIGGVLVLAAFLYFGGGNFIRGRVTKLK